MQKVQATRHSLRDIFQRYLARRWNYDSRAKWNALFKEFVRYYCAVVSRICFLPGDIAGALVPLGDMFNHEAVSSPLEHRYVGWESGKGYVFHAHRNFHVGAEVFVSYGACSNTELALWYGFTLKENPWDSLSFYVHELDKDILLSELVTLDRQGFSLNILRALCKDDSCKEAQDVDTLICATDRAKLYEICLLLESRENKVVAALDNRNLMEREPTRLVLLQSWALSRMQVVNIAKHMYLW